MKSILLSDRNNDNDRFLITDKMIFLGFAAIILFLPLNHTNSIQTAGLLLVICGWLTQKVVNRDFKIPSNPMLPAIVIFSITLFISMITGYDPYYSFYRMITKFLAHVILFIVILDSLSSRKKLALLFSLFFIGNILAIFVLTFQLYSKNFVLSEFVLSILHREFLSIGMQHTSTYLFLILTFIYTSMFFIKEKKWYFFLVPYFFINFFFLFASNQRAGLIAVTFVLFTHLFFFTEHRKKALTAIVIIITISTMLALFTSFKSFLLHEDWTKVIQLDFSIKNRFDSAQGRIVIQKYFLDYLKKKPFAGVGYGRKNMKNVENELNEKRPWDLTHGHNILLNIAVQAGLQGAFALLFLIFMQFKIVLKGLKRADNSADKFFFTASILYLAGFWLRMQIDDAFRYSTELTYWIVMGLATSLWLIQEKEKQETGP